MPTPAVAYLTRSAGYDLGIVISASHNPFEDNGIKVFSGRGEKFTEDVEREVEAIIADSSGRGKGEPASLAPARGRHVSITFASSFLKWRRSAVSVWPSTAPMVRRRRWRGVVCRSRLRDGGDRRRARWPQHQSRVRSTHPERLGRIVVERECQMGVAFDGDGDRAIFVDHRGVVVNGDAVLLMCARQPQREGRLRGNAVVATVMSNIGLNSRRQPASNWCGPASATSTSWKRCSSGILARENSRVT